MSKIGHVQADVLRTIRDYPEWRPYSYERRQAVERLKSRALIATRVPAASEQYRVGYALTAQGTAALSEYEGKNKK